MIVDKCGKGKEIKEICKESFSCVSSPAFNRGPQDSWGTLLPDIRISVFTQTLIVETVNLRDLSRLVVASQDGDSLWVSNLQGYEQGDRLHRIISTIDIVTHEEVVGIRVGTSDPEQFHQVMELAVDVTTHRYGAPLANSVNSSHDLQDHHKVHTTGWTFDSS